MGDGFNIAPVAAEAGPIALENLMLCWSPGGDVMAVHWPDRAGVAAHLSRSDLACCVDWHEMNHGERMQKLWSVVGQIVVRDTVDAGKVRAALANCEDADCEDAASGWLERDWGCIGDMPI